MKTSPIRHLPAAVLLFVSGTAFAAPAAPADPAQARAAAEQLTRLLSEFDSGAVEFLEANKAALRSLFPGDAWSQFEKLVQDYASAEARAQLEQVLKAIACT